MLADTTAGVPRRVEICAIDDTDNGHTRDIEFNRNKLQVARMEATFAGHLLPGEITHEICELAEEQVKSVPKAQRERTTTYNR